MSCGACHAPVPASKYEADWPGWLAGTVRRRSLSGRLGAPQTFSACPTHRIYIVRRELGMLDRRPAVLIRPPALRDHPSGCYGCRAPLVEDGGAIVRMIRALSTIEEYVEMIVRVCVNCAVKVE